MHFESSELPSKNNNTAQLSPLGQRRKNNVFTLMEKNGLSRKEFAEFVGVTYDTLMIYIAPNQNKRQIGAKICSRIEKAFNLPEGAMDTDLYEKNHTNTKKTNSMAECIEEIVDGKLLRVPLFLSQVGSLLNPKTEPYIEEAFITLPNVFGNKVQPENVAAFKTFEACGFLPALSTVFIDKSNTTLDSEEKMYLVSIINQRKLMYLNSTIKCDGIILGRVFFLEMAL